MQTSPASERWPLMVLLCFAPLCWYESASSLYECFFPKYIPALLAGPPEPLSVSAVRQDSGTAASQLTFKGRWPFTSVYLETLSLGSPFLTQPVIASQQQRLCSRPTRQQINRPARSCWNCSGDFAQLQSNKCRSSPTLFVCFLNSCLWGIFVAVARWYWFYCSSNSGEAGEVRSCGRALRAFRTFSRRPLNAHDGLTELIFSSVENKSHDAEGGIISSG